MSAPQFTPGPWSFDGAPDSHIVWSSPENRVCFLTSNGPATANARLIAKAPDMHAALKRIAFLRPAGDVSGVRLKDAQRYLEQIERIALDALGEGM